MASGFGEGRIESASGVCRGGGISDGLGVHPTVLDVRLIRRRLHLCEGDGGSQHDPEVDDGHARGFDVDLRVPLDEQSS